MRLRVVRDGKSQEVEVAPDLSAVTLAGATFPVVVVRSEALRVELEIGGEKVVVENWPDHFPEPPAPVDVNGERAPVVLERLATLSGSTAAPLVAPSAARPASAAPPPAMATSPTGGTPILPPMPGRVIELRVSEGEHVAAGAVLLVLEAMKMRNEVTTPVGGVVRGLRVHVGANARAREPMLFVESA
jgi:glutaconyl-CoA/methylmalonyl-CoA decarboxylase subunit gamma